MRSYLLYLVVLLLFCLSAMGIRSDGNEGERLKAAAEAAVRAKEGFGPETLIRTGSLRRSQDPDYYEMEMNVNWGTDRFIASIRKDGHELIVGKVYPLQSLTPLGVKEGLRLIWGVESSDDLKLREVGPSAVPGFTSYEVVIGNGSASRKGWLTITSDHRFFTLGDVYLLRTPEEVVRLISMGDAPSVGSTHPRVSIVEYSDFECPSCAKMDDLLLNDLLPKHPEVRITFKDFPLRYHPWAEMAAVAGRCAYEISPLSYIRFRQLIFRHQTEVAITNAQEQLLKFGNQAGLDTDSFKSCIDSERTLSAVQASGREAQALQVNVTPTVYVNGVPIAGIWNDTDFDRLIYKSENKRPSDAVLQLPNGLSGNSHSGPGQPLSCDLGKACPVSTSQTSRPGTD